MMFDFSGHMWSCAVWKSFNQLSSWWLSCKRYAYTLIRVSRHYYVIRMFLLCLCIFVSNEAFWSWSWTWSCLKSPTIWLFFNSLFRPTMKKISELHTAGPCITNVIATCRKNFSQWESSFIWKLRCHWLKFLRRVAKTLVIQGPGPLWWELLVNSLTKSL